MQGSGKESGLVTTFNFRKLVQDLAVLSSYGTEMHGEAQLEEGTPIPLFIICFTSAVRLLLFLRVYSVKSLPNWLCISHIYVVFN